MYTKADDEAFELSWQGTPFKFYGTSYNTIYPSINGVSNRVPLMHLQALHKTPSVGDFFGCFIRCLLECTFSCKRASWSTHRPLVDRRRYEGHCSRWVALAQFFVLVASHVHTSSSSCTIAALQGYTNALPNNMYYRWSTTPSVADKARISADVAALIPAEPAFTPTFLAVVTWFRVQVYPEGGSSPSAVDTFQATLASEDSGRSFVTFWLVGALCYAH